MKHLKKDTGGYALLYVLVIVMVLVAISMMICTVALRNLQSQQAAVERMANKYAAQGEIEKIKAIAGDIGALGAAKSGDGDLDAAIRAYESVTDLSLTLAEDGWYHIAQIEKTEGAQTITAVLRVDLEIVVGEVQKYPEIEGNTEMKSVYTINSVSTKFISYAIETTGGDAG